MVELRPHLKPFKPHDTGWETIADIFVLVMMFVQYGNIYNRLKIWVLCKLINLILLPFYCGDNFLDLSFFVLNSTTKFVCSNLPGKPSTWLGPSKVRFRHSMYHSKRGDATWHVPKKMIICNGNIYFVPDYKRKHQQRCSYKKKNTS